MKYIILVCFFVLLPIFGFADWNIETPYADSSGRSAAIAVDSNNDPHILFLVDGDHFYHIYKSGGAWYGPYPIENVNYYTLCRMVDVAMVRDTVNAIMSLEWTAIGDYLVWGKHLGGGVWATQQVPNTVAPSNAGGYLNVAISPGVGNSLFHIIYVHYNYGASILYYRKYDSTWTGAEVVSDVPDVSSGWQHDIAVDANDDPHVVFVFSDEGIKYRRKTGGAWSPVELVSASSDPSFASIALDASDYPHLAYDKDDFEAVCYRAKNAIGWQPEEVIGSGGGWNNYGASIVVSGNEDFVAYYADGDLKFAMRTNGSWSTEVVDTTGDVGTHTSLAIDSEGYAHIAYRDASNERLKYARSTEPVVGIAEADWTSGIKSTGVTIDAHPNPFHDQTTIRYSILARPASQGEFGDTRYMEQELLNSNFEMRKHTLGIYDVTGRLVRSFNLESGIEDQEFEVKWDGTDQYNHRLCSGVYFLRCVWNSASVQTTSAVTEKLILLK